MKKKNTLSLNADFVKSFRKTQKGQSLSNWVDIQLEKIYVPEDYAKEEKDLAQALLRTTAETMQTVIDVTDMKEDEAIEILFRLMQGDNDVVDAILGNLTFK